MANPFPCRRHGVFNCSVCYPRKIKDLPRDEIQAKMNEAKERGWTVYIKITCQNCGERIVAAEPFVIPDECVHKECGHVNRPKEFGMLLMRAFPRKEGIED
jgi:hypothetical protein